MANPAAEFLALGVRVLTVSDTRTLETDKSGALAEDLLREAGHDVRGREIVQDDELSIREKIAEYVADPDVDVVIATGGTGVTMRDVTPEAVAPLVSKAIPGFGELFRALSFEEIGAATIQSRADAALCGTTLTFVLPGSTGAVRLAMEKIILPQLDRRTRPCNFAELMPRVKSAP